MRSDLGRLLRFGLVGGCSTLLYAGLAYGLGRAGLPPVPASMLAHGLAAVFSFNAHRRFSFNSEGQVRAELPRFLAVNATGLGVATLAPLILTEWLGFPPLLGIAAACVLVPLLSFLAMDRFVFGPSTAPLERARLAP